MGDDSAAASPCACRWAGWDTLRRAFTILVRHVAHIHVHEDLLGWTAVRESRSFTDATKCTALALTSAAARGGAHAVNR